MLTPLKTKRTCSDHKPQQKVTLLGLFASAVIGFATSANATGVSEQSERIEDYRALTDKIVKERAATPEDEILRFAGLIRSSVKVNTWNAWKDQQTKSVIINAAVQHPDWSSSYAGVDYARAIADETKGTLLPQFSGGMDYGDRQFGANPVTRSALTKYTSTSMQLNVKQLLYDGFSRWDAWKSTEQKAEAQKIRADIQQSEVILKLLEASLNKQRFELQKYWLLKFNDQRKKTVEKIVKRYNLGASTIYEIARSELKTHDASVSLEQIDQQYKNAISIAQEFDLPFDLNLPTIAEAVTNSESDLEQIIAEHPVIKEAELLVASAQLELVSAQSRKIAPQVNLEFYRGGRDFNGYSQNTYDSSMLVTLTHNIYSGGSDTAKLTQASARLMQMKDDMSSRQKTLRTTFIKTGTDVNALLNALKYRQAAVDASVASFAATSKLFQINRGNLTDFQRVEDDLNEKVRMLIDNWFDLSISYFRHLHVSNTLKSRFLMPYKLEAQPQLKPAL
jgi:adhesin transport system outer membrane protein